jgi:D-3-phosphoglycerate dehydrogenase
MRIAILDDYSDAVRTLAAFRRLDGHDVLVLNRPLSEDVLARRLADREGLVLIRERTRLTRALIDRLPALRVVSQTGRAGPHIDRDACAERGIVVVDGTGSPYSTAELTLALILASARELVTEHRALREGRWQTTLGTTVRGRTLGILGYGGIGRVVAGLARAFGMQVRCFGREGSAQRAAADGVEVARSQRALFESSDVLSMHVKLSPETRGLVGEDDFAAMRPGSLFVNTARAALVAPGALLAGLEVGRPARAAFDVFEHEPTADDPLIRHPRVLATPHLGYVERDSYEAYFAQAFDNLLAAAR